MWSRDGDCVHRVHHVVMLVILIIPFHFQQAVIFYIWWHASAEQTFKTLFIRSDHFTIIVWFFWWNCNHWKKFQTRPKVPGGEKCLFQEMIWWSFFFSSAPKIPVGAQSTLRLGFFFLLKELSGDRETSAMLLPLTGSLCFQSWLFWNFRGIVLKSRWQQEVRKSLRTAMKHYHTTLNKITWCFYLVLSVLIWIKLTRYDV